MPENKKTLANLKRAYESAGRLFSDRQRKRKEHQEKVDEWKRTNTCPHCGHCDPLPQWLEYPTDLRGLAKKVANKQSDDTSVENWARRLAGDVAGESD